MLSNTFLKKLCKNLSENFGNHISQDSHKNQYPCPVCNFGFTATTIQWQILIKFAAEVPYLSYWYQIQKLLYHLRYHLRDHWSSNSGWFVWHQLSCDTQCIPEVKTRSCCRDPHCWIFFVRYTGLLELLFSNHLVLRIEMKKEQNIEISAVSKDRRGEYSGLSKLPNE